MRRLALILVCVAAAGVGGATAGTEPGVVVTTDGQIGQFTIDQTTESQVRALAGKPLKLVPIRSLDGKRRVGRALYYRCGNGCRTVYVISTNTGRLADFWSQSPRFVTERGAHAGMSGKDAASLEHKRVGPGCGLDRYIHLRWDPEHVFVLTVVKGAVETMVYLGPHSANRRELC